MLSDEEKAIEMIEHIQECNTLIGYRVEDRTILAKALINLIEKQSKEIEELKEKNRQGKMRIVQLENEITARIEDVNKYFTPNDKIKAKIEPKLKELDEQINEEWKKYGNSKELQDMEDMYNFLQSLLEKE